MRAKRRPVAAHDWLYVAAKVVTYEGGKVSAALTSQLLDQASGSLARYFSTRILRDLAAPIGGAGFRALIEKDDLLAVLPMGLTLEEFYEAALVALIRQDRSEYVYKNAIARKLLLGRHSVRTAALLFEFKAGNSKLDALLLNGSSHAYEIKTGKDELKRLETQLPDYQARFEYVTVVCSERHLQRLKAMLPSEIGITILSNRYSLSVVRRAAKRTKYLRSNAMLESLRAREYANILTATGSPVAVDKIPNTQLYSYAKNCFELLPPKYVHAAMVQELKERFQGTNVHAAIALPPSLTAAGIGLNISGPQLKRLCARLKVPILQLEMS